MIFKALKSKTAGEQAEYEARRYLEAQGLHYVEKNYHSRHGEIDLIMQDGETLVFVEVRLRKNTQFGGPLASVTASKQKKIINTAQLYMSSKGLLNSTPMRFDVIGISSETTQWVQGAF